MRTHRHDVRAIFRAAFDDLAAEQQRTLLTLADDLEQELDDHPEARAHLRHLTKGEPLQ